MCCCFTRASSLSYFLYFGGVVFFPLVVLAGTNNGGRGGAIRDDWKGGGWRGGGCQATVGVCQEQNNCSVVAMRAPTTALSLSSCMSLRHHPAGTSLLLYYAVYCLYIEAVKREKMIQLKDFPLELYNILKKKKIKTFKII